VRKKKLKKPFYDDRAPMGARLAPPVASPSEGKFLSLIAKLLGAKPARRDILLFFSIKRSPLQAKRKGKVSLPEGASGKGLSFLGSRFVLSGERDGLSL
jgi:hypothetical protein